MLAAQVLPKDPLSVRFVDGVGDHVLDAPPAPVDAVVGDQGGSVGSDAWWVGRNGPTGFYFSDAAIDWVEEVANEELPAAP